MSKAELIPFSRNSCFLDGNAKVLEKADGSFVVSDKRAQRIRAAFATMLFSAILAALVVFGGVPLSAAGLPILLPYALVGCVVVFLFSRYSVVEIDKEEIHARRFLFGRWLLSEARFPISAVTDVRTKKYRFKPKGGGYYYFIVIRYRLESGKNSVIALMRELADRARADLNNDVCAVLEALEKSGCTRVKET